MAKVAAYAAQDAKSPLAVWNIDRRAAGPNDVEIDVLYCGVCHSDVHQARDEWGGSIFPMVPGHEIVGRVKAVGAKVTRFKAGDLVGVGCMVDSCGACPACGDGDEQYCTNGGATYTYNGRERGTQAPTYGGYSKAMTVKDAFVLRIPEGLDPARAAPLLCAGITLYSPLKHWNTGPGKKVGIVGLGGLGHMGVKIAHAMGAHVVLFTTSPSKVKDGLALGADEVVVSTDPEQMKAQTGKLDLIVNTVAAPHDLNVFLGLLARNGTMTLVGVPSSPHPAVMPFAIIANRRSLAGSLIGGVAETQEMLDFCAAKGVQAEIETIPMEAINTAYDRMIKSDVRYRFVIDLATL